MYKPIQIRRLGLDFRPGYEWPADQQPRACAPDRVSETAVRRAEKAGRIGREIDGSWDLAKVQAAWSSNTDRSQQRRFRLRRAFAAAMQASGSGPARSTLSASLPDFTQIHSAQRIGM
jgi:hypothetical protein